MSAQFRKETKYGIAMHGGAFLANIVHFYILDHFGLKIDFFLFLAFFRQKCTKTKRNNQTKNNDHTLGSYLDFENVQATTINGLAYTTVGTPNSHSFRPSSNKYFAIFHHLKICESHGKLFSKYWLKGEKMAKKDKFIPFALSF